jgi:hypothetical protein
MVRLRWRTSMGCKVNKELRLLLLSILLVVVGFVALTWQTKNCYPVEYQDINGSHYVQVCEGD